MGAVRDDHTYLDNNATTRLDPDVLAAMLPLLTEDYGNPSSTHYFGAAVLAQIEAARAEIAALIAARDSEIVFTSGATEANNLALRGVAAARPARRGIIVAATEHAALLEPAERLEQEGYRVTRLAVDPTGLVDLDQLRDSLSDDTLLLSLMLVNNETGVIAPLAQAAALARARGVLVHSDAVQAAGRVPLRVDALGVDLLSLSAHKVHGPKGVGALYVRRGTPLRGQVLGGPQERGRRAGTYNAAGIVGFGKAAALAPALMPEVSQRWTALRTDLEERLTRDFPTAHIVGAAAPRVANTCCVCFAGVEAEALVLLLSERGISVSSGAACSSGSLEPSHVMQAMGIAPEIAQGQLRVSLGRFSTARDVDRLLTVLPDVLERVGRIA